MSDLSRTARELLDIADDAETYSDRDDTIRIAQANALVSIAESLARIAEAFRPAADTFDELARSTEHRAPSTEHVAPSLAGETIEQRAARCGRTVEEQRILAMPAPKGYTCPVCKHDINSHRMHGCDIDGCDCPQPHGRILPGDPNPTT